MDYKLTQTQNGTEIFAEATTGNKQWVAIITDTHPKYNYEREFVAYQKPKTSKRFDGRAMVEEGDVVEMVRYTHSGKNDTRRYYQFVGGELHQIEKTDITKALSEIVVDVATPRDVDFDELQSAVTERHDCDECGQTFTSGHGLAVHAGMVHADDGEEEDEAGDDSPVATIDAPVAVADGGRVADDDGFTLDDYPDEADVGERLIGLDEWGAWYYDADAGRIHNYKREAGADEVEAKRTPIVETEGACEVLEGEDLVEFIRDLDAVTELGDSVFHGHGGVRSWLEVEHTDAAVRHYRADGHLYAYRDGDEHVVVSRGDEPGTRWKHRTSSTVERPVPGQKRWTIPDNWEQRVYSKRDNIAYALYYVPEADVWARVSIPTNNWLVDAWYQVKAVGDLDVKAVGDLASRHDVRQLASEFEDDGDDEMAVVLKEVARNWNVVEEDVRHATEWVLDEGLDQIRPGDQPIHADEGWQVEFHQDRVFRPGDAIKHAVDFSGYDVPVSALLDVLSDLGLPSYYRFELVLDSSEIDMEYYVRGLLEAGVSSAEALDYYFVEVDGMSQSAWGRAAGKSQQTVSKNVAGAKRVLDA
ncbi:hypothetical protein C5B90_19095 [Haloferax sp. Atlit-12N]|uniref:hypothetical protein n=1 Tax=Haloferax sp. Atlit-12N TaxID=2077203 RepID=UPI000E27BD03|nr:hypothetical protein [Haloferax sp. Atlit-12N]RDZ61381.1 hypothetical protein C5B90_19095 [Haloferax sp. Atlit-12N]